MNEVTLRGYLSGYNKRRIFKGLVITATKLLVPTFLSHKEPIYPDGTNYKSFIKLVCYEDIAEEVFDHEIGDYVEVANGNIKTWIRRRNGYAAWNYTVDVRHVVFGSVLPEKIEHKNIVCLSGFVINDIRYDLETRKATFRMAVVFDRIGGRTDFLKCRCYNALAEQVARDLKKGSKVNFMRGELMSLIYEKGNYMKQDLTVAFDKIDY